MSLEYNLMFAVGSKVLCIAENAKDNDYSNYITSFSMSVFFNKRKPAMSLF